MMNPFKKWILNEMPMKTESDLPREVYVCIKTYINKKLDGAIIYYSDKDGKLTLYDHEVGNYLGEIRIVRKEGDDFFNVIQAQAAKGFGPLLYDVAMEYCTSRGSSLTSDQKGSVSQDAQGVWRNYSTRPDVKRELLPFSNWTGIAIDDPANYSYTKIPERIHNLRELGKLLEKHY